MEAVELFPRLLRAEGDMSEEICLAQHLATTLTQPPLQDRIPGQEGIPGATHAYEMAES